MNVHVDYYDKSFALYCSLLIMLQTTHKCRSRTYYLAAETEVEMNKWVMTLCKVLALAETGMFVHSVVLFVCHIS